MRNWWIACLFVLLLVPCVWAQTSTGAVSGTVRDESDSVIPGATVELTNEATRVTLTTVTNDVGFYIYPAVMIGRYRLSVELPGFQTYAGDLTVSLRETVVVDPVLIVGGVESETVDVVADVTPLVTVDSPAVREGMERERIEQLPLNGRNVETLVGLLPGFEGSRTFGAPPNSQEYFLDGSAESDRRWGGVTSPPGLDTIQEFTVESNAISAKYSRPVSVILSTKSGTNAFHGTAFETHRNNSFGLARRREDVGDPPQLIRNEFGVSASGPVIESRTFWFTSYEGLRRRQSNTRGFRVPTMAMRQGDFSDLVDAQGRQYVLYDSQTTDANGQRQAFPGNVIPSGRISPVAEQLFAVTPQPTLPDVNPLVEPNWFGPVSNPLETWTSATRIDHRLSDRDSLYARFTVGHQENSYSIVENGGQTGQPMLNDVAGLEYLTVENKSAAASWSRVLSSTLFNELAVSVRRNKWRGGENPNVDVSTPWADQFGLPNPFGVSFWPRFESTGLGSDSTQYALNTNDTKENFFTFFSVENNVTKVLGKHELLFGGLFRKDFLNTLPQQRFPQPTVQWNTGATALLDASSTLDNPQAVPFTGHNIANMFLGHSQIAASQVAGRYDLTDTEYALYAEDKYRLTPRLTLSLGLRYEYFAGLEDHNKMLVGFDLDSRSIVLRDDLDALYASGVTSPALTRELEALGARFTTPEQVGLPENLVNARHHFGPRLGFAYQALNGKASFVVRGGYSLSYFNTAMSRWFDRAWQNTPLRATFRHNPNDAALSPDGLPNWMLRNEIPWVDGVNTRDLISLDRLTGTSRGSSLFNEFVNPDLKDARVHSWNLTLEKQVAPSTAATLRYVGTAGRNEWQTINHNAETSEYVWFTTRGEPLPSGEFSSVARRPYDQQVYGSISEFDGTGFSNTNAFQLGLTRRYNHGLAFEVFYVHSVAIGTGTSVPAVNQFVPGLLPTDFDERSRMATYGRTTGVPKHRVRWNWLVDLPFDRWAGRPDQEGVLGKIIGGWQFAGIGWLQSTYFTLPDGNWNLTGVPVEVYGKKYPIEDCRSGTCIPGFLWWNGYIPENLINTPNGIQGVPESYRPAVTPLIPWGTTELPENAPPDTDITAFWDSNDVWVRLNDGSVQRVGFNPGHHPWNTAVAAGSIQWNMDASLFKTIPINGRFAARLQFDVFNVLNRPGTRNLPNRNSDGILLMNQSQHDPRTLQLSLRLNW
ncbi:MAG: hypothetical protein GEU99_19920 [Luteitalea sp.]|nr:hypothetical protein [Luteitalea sp.]